MICKVKLEKRDETPKKVITGQVIINGCYECIFNDRYINYGYCKLLNKSLPQHNKIQVLSNCPLRSWTRVNLLLVLHSYTQKI